MTILFAQPDWTLLVASKHEMVSSTDVQSTASPEARSVMQVKHDWQSLMLKDPYVSHIDLGGCIF